MKCKRCRGKKIIRYCNDLGGDEFICPHCNGTGKQTDNNNLNIYISLDAYKSTMNKLQNEIEGLEEKISLNEHYSKMFGKEHTKLLQDNENQQSRIKELEQQIEKLSRAPNKSRLKFWEGFGKC